MRELGQRRINIQQCHRRGHDPAGRNTRPGHDERRARGRVESAQFCPAAAVIAEVKAVVADQDNPRVSPEFPAVELVEQDPDLSIGEGSTRGVTADRGLARVGLSEAGQLGLPRNRRHIAECRFGPGGETAQRIKVENRLRRSPRQVRLVKAGRAKERFPGGGLFLRPPQNRAPIFPVAGAGALAGQSMGRRAKGPTTRRRSLWCGGKASPLRRQTTRGDGKKTAATSRRPAARCAPEGSLHTRRSSPTGARGETSRGWSCPTDTDHRARSNRTRAPPAARCSATSRPGPLSSPRRGSDRRRRGRERRRHAVFPRPPRASRAQRAALDGGS